MTQKESYKKYHSHIAPDLRYGVCKQSALSDTYPFGKTVSTINQRKLKNKHLEKLSYKCLRYSENILILKVLKTTSKFIHTY